MKVPCYKCKDRKIGCHSKCEKYNQYKAEWGEIRKKEIIEQKLKDHIFRARDNFVRENSHACRYYIDKKRLKK